jgi:hypothetical protein
LSRLIKSCNGLRRRATDVAAAAHHEFVFGEFHRAPPLLADDLTHLGMRVAEDDATDGLDDGLESV